MPGYIQHQEDIEAGGGKQTQDHDPTDRVSETEVSEDHQHVKPASLSVGSQSPETKRVHLRILFVCVLVLLVAVGIVLAIVLPRVLDGDDATKPNDDGDASEDDPIGPISFNYTSLDITDNRDGNFFADLSNEALHDGLTDVLQGGKIIAWKHAPSISASSHRIVMDLTNARNMSKVAVYGITWEPWGLHAPVSLRLQLWNGTNANLYEKMVDIEVEQGSWMELFDTIDATEMRLVTQAWLDVICPTGEERVDSSLTNMRCGISEVDFS